MRELKIFCGNWDGKRERAVVSATKKRAQELLGASTAHMRDMFSTTTVIRDKDRVVWDSPETVFERPMDYGPNAPGWRQLPQEKR